MPVALPSLQATTNFSKKKKANFRRFGEFAFWDAMHSFFKSSLQYIRLFRHLKTLNFQLNHLFWMSNILTIVVTTDSTDVTVIKKWTTLLWMRKRRTLTTNFLTKRRAKSFQFHSVAHGWKLKKIIEDFKQRTVLCL